MDASRPPIIFVLRHPPSRIGIIAFVLRQLKNFAHWLIAVSAAWFYGHPANNLTMIGVTGTDGKTTTTSLIYHLLKTAGKKVAMITSVSAKIGDEEMDTGFHVTTPDPWPLQKLLKKIYDRGYKYVVLETTSHGWDQHRLLGINFKIGVVTNITHEHLDYHQTFARYVQAKSKLLKKSEYAILNEDDASYNELTNLLPKTTKIYPYNFRQAPDKLFTCIKKRFPEGYNWSNSLAATTASRLMGLTDEQMCRAIASFPGVKGRMEKIPNQKGLTIVVDFAHTPNALEQAMKSLRLQLKSGKKLIAVYGSAGLRDYRKRPIMGKIGSELADIVILTAEDPRTEDVHEIIDQMKTGATNSHRIRLEPDRQKAITMAVSIAKKGDIIGVFGKGHEQSMCFGTIEYPWSDHEAIKKALQQT